MFGNIGQGAGQGIPCALQHCHSQSHRNQHVDSLSHHERQREFQYWIAYIRTSSAPNLLDVSIKEQLMCPLLWCRTSFPDLASTLHHVASCPWLSDAWYWCPTCCRPERFLEGQNTQKAFRQAPVQASRSKIKTFFRQLSRKKNQRPSSMPPFSSVDSFAYSSTPTADDTPERVELEDTPYEVRPAELETSRYYACAGPWIPVEKANTIYELDAHAYVAAPGPGSPTNYDGHVARHIYAVEEESKYRAGPPPYSLEDGGISDAQSVISYSPKDMLYSGSQALDSARSYNNGLATLPSAGEGELSASSSQRIDSRTRAPTWMLARQTSDDHQLLVGSMVATSQPPPGYHLALCSTQDFAGNPRLQVSEFFEAVAAMSQEWLQRLAFTTKFTPPCADTYARSLFELGVGVLRKLFSHAGSIPTSFRDVFALLHVSVASAYVMFKDDNSYSWSTLMDDAMQWQTLLSNDIERRTFVKVVSLLCQRSRSATSSPMQDSAVEDNFLPEESSVLLLMLGHFTSAAVGSFTDEDSSRLGRDSRGMESFHLFRASMVVKTCTSLLEVFEAAVITSDLPCRQANAAWWAQQHALDREVLGSMITRCLQYSVGLEAFHGCILDTETKVHNGLLRSIREVEVTLISGGRSCSRSSQLLQSYLGFIKILCDEAVKEHGPDLQLDWRDTHLATSSGRVLMLAAQPGFGVRHTSHTPLVKHRTDPAKASPVQRPSLITNVPTSIPTPSPTPPSSHGVDAWSPADKVLHCTRSGCESTFSGKFRKTNLQKHLNHSRIHNPHGGFLCDECGESIGRKDNLDQHKRSVHGVDLPMKRRAASSRTRGPRNEPGDELPRAGEQGSPWELQAVHHRP